jgi:signal transduction histidine kinase
MADRCLATSRRVGDGFLRGWDRWLPWPIAAIQPWRFLFGACAVLIPALVMGLLDPALPVTTPGVVLIVAVAVAASVADWIGGVTALACGTLLLNMLFVGDRRYLNLPQDAGEAIGFGLTIIGGATLICLVEQMKREGADQRRAAAAARAAAHALAALEQSVTTDVDGGTGGRAALTRAIVNAMVRVNRAHAGALFLATGDGSGFAMAAAYGLSGTASAPIEPNGLIAQVAHERRPIAIARLNTDGVLVEEFLRAGLVRSALGVPIIGEDDIVAGVAVIGLLVEHPFTATEIARLEAIARRSALLLAAAEVATEREAQLDLAREAQRRLKLVIDAMPEAVIVGAPPDGRVVGYNMAAEALLGSLSGPDGPVDIAPRLRPVDGHPISLHDLPHLTALSTGMTVEGVELIVASVDGRETPVLASAAPIREPNGTAAAVVTVFRDIATLKEAARLKDEFLSVVSHELRSPLTPILGFVQLVAKELGREGGHDLAVQRLSSVEGHVDRMTRLIDDLLDVSGLKSGTLDIKRSPVDLVAICREVVAGRSASALHQTIMFEAAAPAITGLWDADRLHQVVDNLIGNALKYGPDGGTVTVSARIDAGGGQAVVTVADQGPGIAREDREKIFTPFYRSRGATEGQIAGLGLGLYICHELVAAHGGVVDVDDAMGGGAAFSIRLPLTAQAAAA